MGYKLNVRGASDWVNLLKDLYVEIDNTNWDATSLSGFLDEVQTALDGKKSRNVVKTLLDKTAEAFDVILVDTTAAVTVTLPAAPVQGDEVYVTDVTGNADVSNITIARNGSNINGLAEDMIIDIQLGSVKLIFDNATNGWHIDAGGSFFGNDISQVNDPFLTLNADFTAGTPTENGGIIVSRGDSADVVVRWNESTDVWELTTDGSTYDTILTASSLVVAHSALTGLSDDDHSQYMHNTIDRTVSATHTFNPDTVGAPFVIGANADKQLVSGLNAEYVNGVLVSSLVAEPAVKVSGDLWFQEV
jgi:hypothetical protein